MTDVVSATASALLHMSERLQTQQRSRQQESITVLESTPTLGLIRVKDSTLLESTSQRYPYGSENSGCILCNSHDITFHVLSNRGEFMEHTVNSSPSFRGNQEGVLHP